MNHILFCLLCETLEEDLIIWSHQTWIGDQVELMFQTGPKGKTKRKEANEKDLKNHSNCPAGLILFIVKCHINLENGNIDFYTNLTYKTL